MAFYELSIRQTVYDQQCLNLFNYYSATPGPITDGAEDIVTAFLAYFITRLRAMVRNDGSQYTIDSLYAFDVNDPDDFYEYIYVPPVTGLNSTSGDASSPFMSFAFRTDRWRVGRNRGYKRFSGICELDISGNTFDPGGTILADLVTGLEASLVGSLTAYYPSIAGKEKYVPDPLKPLQVAYRYYDTETEQRSESSTLPQWNAYRLTTQRSRIAGHGQ